MAKDEIYETVIPSAKRLIHSERWQKYEFPTAIAELVDNSIDADSTEVKIRVEFEGENSWVMISDNGKGMSEIQLKEAMRYGSDSEYDEGCQGKFGLGLKKASYSQCRHWTVATRTKSPESKILARVWDLDHVNQTNLWEIKKANDKDLDPKIKEYFRNNSGTIVLWEQLDRILEYDNPNTDRARKKIVNMCRDLEEQLAMIFHRFLRGEVEGKQIKIILNGNEIQAWDPFARNEKATLKDFEPIRIPLEYGGAHDDVVIEPFILPPKKAFSSHQAHSKAAGPNKWNQQQGFYIYRNNRMIQSGGWCRIRAYEEHLKLARFAINFSSKFDGAFKIDVSKMYVQLPPQIRKEIEEKTKPIVARARRIYDDNEKMDSHITSIDSHSQPHQQKTVFSESSPTKISFPGPLPLVSDSRGPLENSINLIPIGKTSHTYVIQEEPRPIVNKLWTLDEILQELKKLAKPAERHVIERIFKKLREQIQKKGT